MEHGSAIPAGYSVPGSSAPTPSLEPGNGVPGRWLHEGPPLNSRPYHRELGRDGHHRARRCPCASARGQQGSVSYNSSAAVKPRSSTRCSRPSRVLVSASPGSIWTVIGGWRMPARRIESGRQRRILSPRELFSGSWRSHSRRPNHVKRRPTNNLQGLCHHEI